MSDAAQRLHEMAVLARARAGTYHWLSAREPYRRTLTQEECVLLAREAEAFARAFEELEKEAVSRV